MGEFGSASPSRAVLLQLNTNTKNFIPTTQHPTKTAILPQASTVNRLSDSNLLNTTFNFDENRKRAKEVEKQQENNAERIDQEMRAVQNKISVIEEEMSLRTMDEETSRTFSDIKSIHKPAALVAGAVPLFKGSEEVVTKTNVLLHKEIQSKVPEKNLYQNKDQSTKKVIKPESQFLEKTIKQNARQSLTLKQPDESLNFTKQISKLTDTFHKSTKAADPVRLSELSGLDQRQIKGKIVQSNFEALFNFITKLGKSLRNCYFWF